MTTSPAPHPKIGSDAVLKTLLMTDLVDSTKLVKELGDARAFEVATRHDRVARDLLPGFHGLEIDKTDGFLLLFGRPIDAVGYALAYHRALVELSVELGVQIRSRAGIHFGDVYLRENPPEDVARGAKPLEVEGLAKPMAARVTSLAGGKQTLLTEGAFNLARQAAGDSELAGRTLSWLAHGPFLFKGLDEPVDVYEVGIPGESALEVPPDSAKAQRAVAKGDELTLGWRPAPGQAIPRREGWVLERKLGEGGFGEVWLAVQAATGEPRGFKFCWNAEHLRTFKREVTLFRLLRESLGNRSEIVRILDWSFDEAPYYLEVEHVEGGDLPAWATSRGGLAAVPMATRLEIVAQVADALAAAHSVGVLHKDVKPHNVLITTEPDGGPQAKLTDFGISEVLDHSQLLARGITVMGLTEVVTPDSPSSMSGTRLYMAPEVTEGRTASIQADIFALGVILYQMAVGDFGRALGSGWARDVGDDLLAADIAEFVDREPSRRPASAREVAERLRRLDHRRADIETERRSREEAEAARLAVERYKRRRKVLGVVAAVALVVLAVVSVLAVQAVRARRVAEQRRAQAEDLIGYMIGDLREKLEPVGRLEILDDVGNKAMDYFAAVPESELSDDELSKRSKTLYQIGDVDRRRGDFSAARKAFEESLALAESLAARDPDNDERLFELGQSHFWLGQACWNQGSPDLALREFEAYLQVAEELVSREPENRDWQVELSDGHGNVGFILEARGDLEAAQEHYYRQVAIIESLVGQEPARSDWQFLLASAHLTLGSSMESLGHPEQAIDHYRDNLEITQRLVAQEPENVTWLQNLATSHSFLRTCLEHRGDLEGALAHAEAFLKIAEGLAARDDSNTEWKEWLATAHTSVGRALNQLQKPQAGLPHLRNATAIFLKISETEPSATRWRRKLGYARIETGYALMDEGDFEQAQIEAQTACDLLESVVAGVEEDRKALRDLGECQLLLGELLSRTKRKDLAQAEFKRAFETLSPLAESSEDGTFLAPLARALLQLGRRQEATLVLERLRILGFFDSRLERALPLAGMTANSLLPSGDGSHH